MNRQEDEEEQWNREELIKYDKYIHTTLLKADNNRVQSRNWVVKLEDSHRENENQIIMAVGFFSYLKKRKILSKKTQFFPCFAFCWSKRFFLITATSPLLFFCWIKFHRDQQFVVVCVSKHHQWIECFTLRLFWLFHSINEETKRTID